MLDNGLALEQACPMKKLPRKDQRRTNQPGRGSPKRGSPNRGSPREDRRRPRFSRELSILYEDDAVVIVDKPPGLMAVPVRGLNTPSALSLLVVGLQPRKQQALIVHRIDRFSSGALLFAKTSRDRNLLVQQFLAHTPVRKYLAVVRGRLEVESGTLIHHFRKDGMMQQLRTAKDPKATRAELRYSVERRFANASLVRVELETGLQNQIRAQFAAMGHPVIGDRKYHPAESSEPLIARVALHAAHLTFVHPRTGKSISIDCKPPADFQYLVRELSRSTLPAQRGAGKPGAQ
jgi:23S rRNA pseudouridine1911/1915/1917 synthase